MSDATRDRPVGRRLLCAIPKPDEMAPGRCNHAQVCEDPAYSPRPGRPNPCRNELLYSAGDPASRVPAHDCRSECTPIRWYRAAFRCRALQKSAFAWSCGRKCRDRGHLALVRGRDALEPRDARPAPGDRMPRHKRRTTTFECSCLPLSRSGAACAGRSTGGTSRCRRPTPHSTARIPRSSGSRSPRSWGRRPSTMPADDGRGRRRQAGGATRSVNVIGPSLVRVTCMRAPKRPVSTSGCSARARRTA